ncbi:hypothetical protein PSHT_12688 [Puccinia striiformis]|uniref:DUF6589 domain-containing protein n=1 Tax=Puccinia striiformis TaxID=27350 RepID=A0A2S4UUX2_9BASI|nr:hypothetical protein PSHT_12688 [Puccinia striiformis]
MDPSAPLVDKIIYICDVIQHLGLNPKSFITSFLEINNPDLKSRRGYWGISRGWPSTFELLGAIQGQFMRNAPGALKWSEYIQDQNPTSGIHPNGSYISSAAITPEVFNSDSKERHYEKLTTLEMPFLYQMLMRMLSNGSHPEDATEEELHPPVVLGQQAPIEVLEEDLMEREGFEYARSKNTTSSRHSRYKRIAFSVCGMLSFAKNRRHNVLQVENSIRFLACGMSERVNEYLHHLGLTSSRQTAIDSLRTLSAYAESNLRKVMALEALLESLDLSEITLQSYNQALQTVRTMNITPRDFLPDRATEDHYVQVWKSQLATVMKKYIAIPATTEGAHPTQPPPLEVLSHAAPDFHMLKLMDEADNSAEGIGQVMESIRRQTGLTPAEFVGRLQPMEGDLGTCQNFHSMRALRAPNNRPEENMNNITFQLGASHTLWNIGQTIFTKHFGDSNNGENMGAWRTLNALGTPPNKVLQKKDFTGMIRHLERVHEATLFHCLRVIMKIEGQPIRDTLPTIPTSRWNQVIDDCYLKYCSPAARRQAYEKCRVDKSMQRRKLDETELDEVKKRHKQSKLSNLLVRLHEFSTVVEANRAMKQGDIGRLINIWRMWSVMSQSLPGLTHYATYLPRLVLLLTKMAFDSDLLDQYDRKNHYRDITIDDSLVEGVGCFQDIISHKDHNLSRLRSHIPTYHQRHDDEEVSQARNMLMSDEDAMGSDKIMDESDNPEEMDPPSSDCM